MKYSIETGILGVMQRSVVANRQQKRRRNMKKNETQPTTNYATAYKLKEL
jgi:hypothetical protein